MRGVGGMCFPATKLLSPFRLGVPSTFSIQFSLESFVGQLLLLQESSSAEALLTVVIVATALLPVVWTEVDVVSMCLNAQSRRIPGPEVPWVVDLMPSRAEEFNTLEANHRLRLKVLSPVQGVSCKHAAQAAL